MRFPTNRPTRLLRLLLPLLVCLLLVALLGVAMGHAGDLFLPAIGQFWLLGVLVWFFAVPVARPASLRLLAIRARSPPLS
jgi:hypothetical protein